MVASRDRDSILARCVASSKVHWDLFVQGSQLNAGHCSVLVCRGGLLSGS